jgi:putative nucleotidyltransferase-like protein
MRSDEGPSDGLRSARAQPVGVRAFASAVIARETLRDVAIALHRARIPVMPLKGVLFQLILYEDPAERALCDVDVLVPERHFTRAIDILVQHGYRPASAGPSWIEAAFASPRGLPLDLHRRIFCARRYRLSTRDLFMRATVDQRLLGVPLWLQHPLDTLAHLVGKLVSDHVHAPVAPRLAELEKWIEHRHIGPELAVRHLVRCGLARAARRVFALGAREREHPFHAAALRALPADPIGDALVTLADQLAARREQRAFGPLSAHLLNASLWRGTTSLALAAMYAAEHAYLARAAGTRGGYWAPFFAESSSSARRRASSARSV